MGLDVITQSCIVYSLNNTRSIMKKVPAGPASPTHALFVAIAWMLAIQALAVLGWHLGLLTRQAALMHWLVVGVLPPALALWQSSATETSTP